MSLPLPKGNGNESSRIDDRKTKDVTSFMIANWYKYRLRGRSEKTFAVDKIQRLRKVLNSENEVRKTVSDMNRPQDTAGWLSASTLNTSLKDQSSFFLTCRMRRNLAIMASASPELMIRQQLS